MDQKRQGEIALLIVKHTMRKRGVTVSQDNMGEFGNVSKAIGVSVEEMKEFARPLIEEIIEECFASKK